MSAEGDALAAWFEEIRGLLRDLPAAIPVDDVEITVVACGDYFGARAWSFAATGDTPEDAMRRLRDRVRAALPGAPADPREGSIRKGPGLLPKGDR